MNLIPSPRSFKHRSNFYEKLEQLLASGVPPARCFRTLGRSGSRAFSAKSMEAKAQAIEQGFPLADSLFVGSFPSRETLDITLVDAAEKSGRLVEVLGFLSEYYLTIAQVYKKVINGTILPVILFHVAVMVVGVVHFFLNDFDLAGAARLVAAFFIPAYVVVFGILFISFNKRISILGLVVEKIFSVIPVLGNALRTLSLTRFTLTLYSMLNAGAGVMESLLVSGKTSGSLVLNGRMRHHISRLEDGYSTSQILSFCRYFPEDYLVSLEVAEEAGQVDETLKSLYLHYQEETQRLIQTFGTLLVRLVYLLISIFIIFQIFKVLSVYLGMVNSVISDI